MMSGIDWAKAPEWARYWAEDKSGVSYWFELEPIAGLSSGRWRRTLGRTSVASFNMPRLFRECDWPYTVHERPEEQQMSKESDQLRQDMADRYHSEPVRDHRGRPDAEDDAPARGEARSAKEGASMAKNEASHAGTYRRLSNIVVEWDANSVGKLPAALMAASDDYADLRAILDEAYDQASNGKGRERHADGNPWTEQPICAESRAHGSMHFVVGQARKKALEALRLDPARARCDLLGAIVYLAAAVRWLDEQEGE